MKLQASAAILAGGENKRNKGFPKIFEEIDGKSILHRQLSVLENLFEEVIIVAHKQLPFPDKHKHKVIYDIFEHQGPLGGIHSALYNCKYSSLFVLAGDMPYPNSKIIKKMLLEFFDTNANALIPKHNKGFEPLHSVYHKNTIPAIEKCLKSNNSPKIICILDYIEYKTFTIKNYPKSFKNINNFR